MFSIRQRAKHSFRNALLSGKTTPQEKFLPESPSILLFCGLYGVRGENASPPPFTKKLVIDFPKKWQKQVRTIQRLFQGLKQQPEITLNGRTLTIAETPILTEPMEQYQMAGTKGYVLVLPDEAASQLVGEKIRLAMKLEDGGYPELKSDLKQFLNSGKWQPELQAGQQLPEKVTMGVTVKAWGVANSLTGFTAISFCGLYLSIIFIILSCSVLAFEQLSAIDKNQKNYAVIDRLGVPGRRQASLIRRELSTVFLIPLLFPLLLTVLLITGAQFFFGEAILQQGLVPLYGLATILLFCAIYLTYFGATMFLFKRVILRPEMR